MRLKAWQTAGAALLVVSLAAGVPALRADPPPPRTVAKTTTVPARPRVVSRPAGSVAEMRVVSLVNDERSRRGLQPLETSPVLMDVSRSWSEQQAARRRMSHSKNGYAENVAYGQDSPESVMRAWMNSPGHRKNILNSRAGTIGVGCARSADGRLFWTQSFR